MKRLVEIGIAIGLGLALAGGAVAQSNGKIAWRVGPQEKDIYEVYPLEAALKRQNGTVKLRCDGAADDRVNCTVASEEPAGAGFGPAALKLTQRYRLAPGQTVRGLEIPVEFFIPPAPTAEDLELPVLVRMPGEQERYDAWPAEARALGLGGGVGLNCVVDEQGLLRDCDVANERWPGLGFALAALTLTKSYRYLPANRAGRPTAVRMPVYVLFECGARCTPLDLSKLNRGLAVRVPWVKAPTPAQVAAAYPAEAKAAGLEGKVILDCRFRADGRLRNCEGQVVEPAGQGFLEAAKALSAQFVAPTNSAQSLNGMQVLVPVAFQDGGAKTGRPEWRLRPTVADFAAAYPADARTAGKSGRVALDCVIGDGGVLSACIIGAEDPPGSGFGNAALNLSSKFAMTLWSPDGLSTIGGKVRAPITFDVPSPTSKAANASYPTITNPEWATRPNGLQLVDAYPERAMRRYMSGQVRLRCIVLASGDVANCKVIEEAPIGFGFGDAAIRLSKHFRMKPMMVDGRPVMPGGAEVEFPVGFRLQ